MWNLKYQSSVEGGGIETDRQQKKKAEKSVGNSEMVRRAWGPNLENWSSKFMEAMVGRKISTIM